MNRPLTPWTGYVVGILMMFALASAHTQEISDRDRGFDAYWALDYDTAIELLTPLAESGDVEAAYFLGMMYDPVSQYISHFDERYHAEYYDAEKAFDWYKMAMDRGYAPAFIRGGFLLPFGTPDHAYRTKAFRIWRTIWLKNTSSLSPDEKFLFLRMVLLGKRQRHSYIYWFESIEPTLEACSSAGDEMCYYYLGLIQLDAAEVTYSGFDRKHLDAWVNFSLAEKMGNRHAEVHRHVIGEGLSEEETETVQAMLLAKEH